MSDPKVSVVMSCYNAEHYVDRAVNSILNQSYSDFEFIIVDDGSTDRTLEKLKKWLGRDKRIILIINKVNEGLSVSLNKGIKKARASYIARMDADDEAYHERIEKQMSYVSEHPEVDILGTAITTRNYKGMITGKKFLPAYHDEIIHRVFRKTLVFHPTILIRKKVYTISGGYDPNLKWAEDADLWYRIYDKFEFHNLQEPLLIYTLKKRLTLAQASTNINVKISNLKKRNILFAHLPALLRDVVYMSIRMVGL